jgi:hypothetical protein
MPQTLPTGNEPPRQQVIDVRLEFYRGVKEIAAFLKISERYCRTLLNSGKLPAKKDAAGTWVLTNLDYYQSLQG